MYPLARYSPTALNRYLTRSHILGLTSVHLHPSPSSFPSFSLQRLEVSGPNFSLSPLPWYFIFTTSVRHLKVDGRWFREGPDLLDAFAVIAPHLERLEMYYLPPSYWNRVFVSCAGLNSLELLGRPYSVDESSRLISFVDSFPKNQIKNLSIDPYDVETPLAVEILGGLLDAASLGNLAHLTFGGLSRENVLEEDGGEEVLKRWAEKGVNIEFHVGEES